MRKRTAASVASLYVDKTDASKQSSQKTVFGPPKNAYGTVWFGTVLVDYLGDLEKK